MRVDIDGMGVVAEDFSAYVMSERMDFITWMRDLSFWSMEVFRSVFRRVRRAAWWGSRLGA